MDTATRAITVAAPFLDYDTLAYCMHLGDVQVECEYGGDYWRMILTNIKTGKEIRMVVSKDNQMSEIVWMKLVMQHFYLVLSDA